MTHFGPATSNTRNLDPRAVLYLAISRKFGDIRQTVAGSLSALGHISDAQCKPGKLRGRKILAPCPPRGSTCIPREIRQPGEFFSSPRSACRCHWLELLRNGIQCAVLLSTYRLLTHTGYLTPTCSVRAASHPENRLNHCTMLLAHSSFAQPTRHARHEKPMRQIQGRNRTPTLTFDSGITTSSKAVRGTTEDLETIRHLSCGQVLFDGAAQFWGECAVDF